MEHTRKTKTDRQWLCTAGALVLLLLFGLFINRHIHIDALYGDDLYLWSFYGCEDFWSFTFPKVTKGNFRPFYWAISYLEFWLIGPHVHWYARFNVLLNVLIAWVIYFFSRRLTRLTNTRTARFVGQGVGLLTGGLYLQSHFAAYQIAQVLGLLESLALLLALLTLWGLFDYLEGRGKGAYLRACLSFFLVIFTHERYIALAPLFYLAVFMHWRNQRRIYKAYGAAAMDSDGRPMETGKASAQKRERRKNGASDTLHRERIGAPLWELLLPALILFLFFAVRMAVAGEAIPVGTAGTKVQDTFSLSQAIGFAWTQVAYIFGINAGHAIYCGVSFLDSPRWVWLLIGGSWLCLLGMLILYGRNAWQRGHITPRLLGEHLLFIGFIGLCIGSSSITIRLETRWVYVSYTAALLYLSFLLGELAKGHVAQETTEPRVLNMETVQGLRTRAAVQRRREMEDAERKKACLRRILPFSVLFLLYGLVMTPVEHFDREHYDNIFFFFDQDRVNSLAACTIDAVGAENFLGKKQVYIFYNYYEMTDFYAEYFYKPFDPEKTGQGTEIHFINRVEDLPADASEENSMVLMEQGNRGYLDVTAQAFGKAAWDELSEA